MPGMARYPRRKMTVQKLPARYSWNSEYGMASMMMFCTIKMGKYTMNMAVVTS